MEWPFQWTGPTTVSHARLAEDASNRSVRDPHPLPVSNRRLIPCRRPRLKRMQRPHRRGRHLDRTQESCLRQAGNGSIHAGDQRHFLQRLLFECRTSGPFKSRNADCFFISTLLRDGNEMQDSQDRYYQSRHSPGSRCRPGCRLGRPSIAGRGIPRRRRVARRFGGQGA